MTRSSWWPWIRDAGIGFAGAGAVIGLLYLADWLAGVFS